MERLEQILQRLRECGLKLSPKICSFLQDRVKYVGHIVSKDGIEADPEKVEKVTHWPTPTSPEDVSRICWILSAFCQEPCDDNQASQ
jgi:hypothetical protein